jgi:hypothetical protein
MSVSVQNLAPWLLWKPIPTMTLSSGGQQKDDLGVF